MGLWARGLSAVVAGGVCLGLWGVAAAQEAKGRPSLLVELRAGPADRPRLRALLAGDQARRLEAWRRGGDIAGYRLLFTRYADNPVWDAMEVIEFADEAAMARWNAVERRGAGGLTPEALALVREVATTPADEVRAGAGPPAAEPVFLAIPYQALVPIPDYVRYLDGYTVPQFDGWIREGVLAGYQIELSRFPADRAWAATILLRYRDDAALAKRAETTAKVRARLAHDPAWKAISDDKKSVRTEKVAAVADQIAAGGVD
jgi:hypothetical protein